MTVAPPVWLHQNMDILNRSDGGIVDECIRTITSTRLNGSIRTAEGWLVDG